MGLLAAANQVLREMIEYDLEVAEEVGSPELYHEVSVNHGMNSMVSEEIGPSIKDTFEDWKHGDWPMYASTDQYEAAVLGANEDAEACFSGLLYEILPYLDELIGDAQELEEIRQWLDSIDMALDVLMAFA